MEKLILILKFLVKIIDTLPELRDAVNREIDKISQPEFDITTYDLDAAIDEIKKKADLQPK